LAHLVRRDGQWNLVRQLATAVFFFQPLLWRLARRLETSSEEICDDYVVQYGSDRQAYAHRLVDIAALSSASVAAVGVVSLRSLLAQRVARILNTSRSLSLRAGIRVLTLVLLGGLVGTTGVSLVGIGRRPLAAESDAAASRNVDGAREADAPHPGGNGGQTAEGAASEEGDDLIAVRGRVVDPEGRPVGGADVYVLRWYSKWGERKPLGQTRSDPDGRFEISYRKSQFRETSWRHEQWREAFIAAFAAGYGPDWVLCHDIPRSEQPTLRLTRDDVPIEGRIVDRAGRGVAGATIAVEMIAASRDEDLSAWITAVRAGQTNISAYRAVSKELPTVGSQRWQDVRTDAEGRFRLSGIGRERVVYLQVTGATIVTKTIFVATRRMEAMSQPAYPDPFFVTNYGAEFEYRAAPSRPIEGVVRDAKTGEVLPGVHVWSAKFAGEGSDGSIRTRTDKDGRYRLDGMPKGEGNVVVVVPVDLPYFTQEVRVPDPVGMEPVKLDIQLHRGVWVTGRVADAATGKPVAAKMKYIPFPDNPSARDTPEFVDRSRDAIDRYRTRADGSYRLVALPGRGIVGVESRDAYPGGQGYEAIPGIEDRAFGYHGRRPPTREVPTAVKEIHPGTSEAEVVCDFVLHPGRAVRLRVVGPSGAPLAGVDVDGWPAGSGGFRRMETETFELPAFRAGENRSVLLHHKERRVGKGLRVKPAEGDAGPIIVKLEPCATVSGRLVDGNGRPVRGAFLIFYIAGDGDFAPNLDPIGTDAEGRFVRDDVLPGLPYGIFAEGADIGSVGVAKELTVEPGEATDLGTINVTREDRPEPKRSKAAVTPTKKGPPGGEQAAAPAPPARPAIAGGKLGDAETREKMGPSAEVSGRVVGSNGKPVAGARVAAIGTKLRASRGGDLSPQGEVLAEATTDEQGNYQLRLRGVSSKTHRYVNVIARADGAGLAWQRLDPDARKVDASFKLPAEEPIRGRLIDRQGKPAAGVRMSIISVTTTSKDEPPAEGVGFDDFEDLPAAWPQPVTADELGRFVIHNVPAGHGMLLRVVGTDRCALQDLALNTGMAEERGEGDGTYRPQVRNFRLGEEAVLTLAPAQIFEGVVRYEDTGEPAPGARLTIWASQQEYSSMISIAGKADAQGRYRLYPYAGIQFGVTAYPPDGAPYVIREVRPIAWAEGTTLKRVDVALRRGVLVRGKVVEAGTNAAVAGATIQYVPEEANNPYRADDILTGWQGIQLSGDNGGFKIAILPGAGRLLVHGPHREFVLQEIGSRQLSAGRPGGQRNYAHAILRVNPEPKSPPIDVTLELQRGAKTAVRLTKESGEPVDEALVITRLNISPLSLYWRGFPMEALGGRFELSGLAAGREYPVYFLDAKRRLGATAVLKASGEVRTIVLAPCGQATAKLVDSQGRPLPAMHPLLEMVVTAGVLDEDAVLRGELAADADFVANIDQTNYWPSPKTDREGRITFPALVPGGTYRLLSFRGGKRAVAREFTVKPRETLDLGEIVFQDGK
jgi:protocatechuate 3,4-dioxygenase beta subunit